jgi:hypothetical protein
VAASLPATEIASFGYSLETDLGKTGEVKEGHVAAVLRANSQLQEALESLVLSISTSAFDNSSTTASIVEKDNQDFNEKQARTLLQTTQHKGIKESSRAIGVAQSSNASHRHAQILWGSQMREFNERRAREQLMGR